MIIPVPALWSHQKLADPNDQIDRAIQNRSHRLIAGVAVSQDFTRVAGALLITVGRGKYLRRRHIFEVSIEIPASISNGCREFFRREEQSTREMVPLMADLAELQSALIDKLKRHAGKYVDRVIAVAVTDPGVWITDFDGKESYRSFCDADKLAELTGLTVIDALPARDLQVGGRGRLLAAIPLWLLAADRNPKIAKTSRAVLMTGGMSGDDGGGFYLPPSDGLDADLPEIRHIDLSGWEFCNHWSRAIEAKTNRSYGAWYAEGRDDVELRQRLQQALPFFKMGDRHVSTISIQQPEVSASVDLNPSLIFDTKINKQLAAIIDTCAANSGQSLANLVKTLTATVVDHAVEQLGVDPHSAKSVQEILVAVPASMESPVIHRLQERFQGKVNIIQSVNGLGVSESCLPAAISAMLGLLHIDQLPANVPWLTGANSQRILGRLTPGRPGNWRQLVRMMADFQPAAMKLKDAV